MTDRSYLDLTLLLTAEGVLLDAPDKDSTTLVTTDSVPKKSTIIVTVLRFNISCKALRFLQPPLCDKIPMSCSAIKPALINYAKNVSPSSLKGLNKSSNDLRLIVPPTLSTTRCSCCFVNPILRRFCVAPVTAIRYYYSRQFNNQITNKHFMRIPKAYQAAILS